MQDKKKRVITGDKVLFIGGLIGTVLVLASMGVHWVRHGTPFIDGLGIFQNSIADSLFLLVLVVIPFIWGLFENRKNKHNE